MAASPLTQQARPQSFQPKIVQLYEQLFLNAEFEPSEGFWREFFLLSPDTTSLGQILDQITPDDIIQLQDQTQELFSRSVKEAASGTSQTDLHSLETLITFLGHVLTKKYTNPSSDIISVLAGIDEADHIVPEFVSCIDRIIRNGPFFLLRLRAVEVGIAMVSGGYKTTLVSYFMHKDLFPSLMKFVHDSDNVINVFESFLLLGLLANYNKFEFQNPYQLRLDDFVNENTIRRIVQSIGITCSGLRNEYVSVQGDLPEGWNLSSTLNFIGLGMLSRSKTTLLTPEEMKTRFAALPSSEAAILLAVYDFVNANKLFAYNLVTYLPEKRNEESPFSSFLSLTSYLLQHAYRTHRTALYAVTNLFVLRILVEDPVVCKQICNNDKKIAVRLCRQRPPYVPMVIGERVSATAIFDIMIDAISHNLRRSLDMDLYCHVIFILFRLFTYVSSNKTRLEYHWSELWRALLTLARFLTTYQTDMLRNHKVYTLAASISDLLTFSVAAGDTFLPDPASYDDLFYKIVENGPVLAKLKEIYNPSTTKNQVTSTRSIDTLLSVSTHFLSLLFHPDKGKAPGIPENTPVPDGPPSPSQAVGRKKNLSPGEVHEIIKQGYDTLSIQPEQGLNTWEKWREVEWRPELKRVSRCAVDDSRVAVQKLGHEPIFVKTEV